MRKSKKSEEIEYEGSTCVAIGKFDGIHLGHQKLIKEMVKENSLLPVVFTFSFASEVFLKNVQRILSDEERREKFRSLGVEILVEYDLNADTCKIMPEDFVRDILIKRLHVKKIFCGPDLSFGYMGKGNVELLKQMSSELDIQVCVVEKVKYGGLPISSTRIRKAIENGNQKKADKMMGNC